MMYASFSYQNFGKPPAEIQGRGKKKPQALTPAALILLIFSLQATAGKPLR
jgi:hypothetical protein